MQTVVSHNIHSCVIKLACVWISNYHSKDPTTLWPLIKTHTGRIYTGDNSFVCGHDTNHFLLVGLVLYPDHKRCARHSVKDIDFGHRTATASSTAVLSVVCTLSPQTSPLRKLLFFAFNLMSNVIFLHPQFHPPTTPTATIRWSAQSPPSVPVNWSWRRLITVATE